MAGLTRRDFLRLVGEGSFVATALPGIRTLDHLHPALVVRTAPFASASLVVDVHRRDDFFLLQFQLFNLQLTGGNLTAINTAQPSYVAVMLPPQHVAEQALPDQTPFPAAPLQAQLAGPSQLVFQVPATSLPLPFTLANLLLWKAFVPQLVPCANPPSSGNLSPSAPGQLQSWIEAPWGLYLSPDSAGGWNHVAIPVTHNGLTELWHTRLGVGTVEPPTKKPNIRAVWTPGYPSSPEATAFVTSLAAADRKDIVTLTSRLNTLPGIPAYTPVPIPADLVLLSSFGASLNLHGSWNEPSASSLLDWRHRAAIGRDSYVRVMRAGHLFPGRHRAVLVTVTDREFRVSSTGDSVAYLIQRNFVRVAQPTVVYPGSAGNPYAEPNGGRQNPFRQVEITTISTPNLDVQGGAISGAGLRVPPPSVGPPDAFWLIALGGTYLQMHHVATDWEGNTVEFTTPLIFVQAADSTTTPTIFPAYSATAATTIEAAYSSSGRNRADTHGQEIAFAEADPTHPGRTAAHTDDVTFGTTILGSDTDPTTLQPVYFPVLAQADIKLPGAAQVSGSDVGSQAVTINGTYVSTGFPSDNSRAEIFLDFLSPPGLTFGADKSGGVSTPNIAVGSMARDLGPVNGAGDLLAGNFNPASFFGGQAAMLLGGVNLFDIINPTGFASDATGWKDKIPQQHTQTINDSSGVPQQVVVTIDWTPDVKADPLGLFQPGSTCQLTIHAKITTQLTAPFTTSYDIDGVLTDFTLVLFGSAASFISVAFKKIHFSARTGGKVNVDVDIDTVTFDGPLTFINLFEQLMNSLGSGPSIDVSGGGIDASYSLAIPTVGVGVFSLQNIRLAAGLNIPFDGQPVRLRFAFCTREHPFLLSVMIFGGGGFFGISLGVDGVEMLEVSLEFGVTCALDFGVASGSVHIMAGIYFKLQTTPGPPSSQSVELTGFVRAGGELEVLGIISISVEFYLGLTYLNPGKAYGKATLTLTVSIAFFSVSVSLTVEKRLGGGGDPSFKDQFPPDSSQDTSSQLWTTYCQAFA